MFNFLKNAIFRGLVDQIAEHSRGGLEKPGE